MVIRAAAIRLLSAALIAGGSATAVQAGITISATPGNAVYSGPTATYDFDTPAPITGGQLRNASQSGVTATPLGSTGNYLAIGPSNGSTSAFLDLSGWSAISAITFIWGSVDTWNFLDIVGRDGATLRSFDGNSVALSPNGSWTAEAMNPLALISIDGADRANIGGLRFSSGINAFELDTISIAGAIPEPATWAMMVLGFGLLGGAMRANTRKAGLARGELTFV